MLRIYIGNQSVIIGTILFLIRAIKPSVHRSISSVHPMGVSRVLFQAPLSGGLKVAEGAGEVLNAVVNGPAKFGWFCSGCENF